MTGGMRTGVLLVNTGSPSAPEPEAVKSYLAEFLMDPNVRPMAAAPWWLILHLFILPSRKVRSARKYREIWGAEGSPLLAGARHLASRTEAELGRRLPAGEAPLVRAAMSYGEPNVATVLRELRDAGCARLVVIPLYPQSARSTSGAVMLRVNAKLREMDWDPEVRVVESYGDEPGYVRGIAGKLRAAKLDPERDRVMFSFHSIPQPDVDAGDTYPQQAERSCELVAAELGLGPDRWTVSFQSPFEDSRTWHDPFTSSIIEGVAARTEGRLLFICPGFSIDCLETLYDVQHEFRPRAEGAFKGPEGAHAFEYVPCLNADDAAVSLMADLVKREL